MGNLSAVVEKRLMLSFQLNSAGMLAKLFPQDGKTISNCLCWCELDNSDLPWPSGIFNRGVFDNQRTDNANSKAIFLSSRQPFCSYSPPCPVFPSRLYFLPVLPNLKDAASLETPNGKYGSFAFLSLQCQVAPLVSPLRSVKEGLRVCAWECGSIAELLVWTLEEFELCPFLIWISQVHSTQKLNEGYISRSQDIHKCVDCSVGRIMNIPRMFNIFIGNRVERTCGTCKTDTLKTADNLLWLWQHINANANNWLEQYLKESLNILIFCIYWSWIRGGF